jgi:hypothetical protein
VFSTPCWWETDKNASIFRVVCIYSVTSRIARRCVWINSIVYILIQKHYHQIYPGEQKSEVTGCWPVNLSSQRNCSEGKCYATTNFGSYSSTGENLRAIICNHQNIAAHTDMDFSENMFIQ